jgi:hypothetical protein
MIYLDKKIKYKNVLDVASIIKRGMGLNTITHPSYTA